MTRLRTIRMLALLALALPAMLYAQPQPGWEIESPTEEGGVEYDFQTQIAIATNGVLIKYSGAVLTAQKVTLNQQTGEAVADGAVRIQQEDLIYAGDHISYNFKTHRMDAQQFRTGKSPVFAMGHGLHADVTNRFYSATNAYITADDVAEPAIKVRANYIKIIPGDRIEARHATLYLGDVPVFYFPFYSRNLGARANNFNFIPGYRSSFGPFLLGSYVWFLNEALDGAAHVDYRERRGLGTGPDFNFHLGRWGDGTFKYYYLHDEDPNASLTNAIPDNRQRVNFSWQANPFTNFNVKSVVRYQSDFAVVREFFEGEYRQNAQPSTFLEVNKFWQNFSLDLYAQPRVHDFLETIERLPEVRLTGYRQQLGDSSIYYESESSAGYYRRLFPDTNTISLSYSAARADTYHQLLLPQTFFGWLNVTPRVGGRFTYYSKASGPGAATDEESRGVLNTGIEVSFKASRLWPAVQNKLLDVDGLRHIIEPSVNYVFVPHPVPLSSRTNDLPQFDYQMPSLRLLPIEFPDYNAIDSIDSQNVMRFGLHNKLQTKRHGEVVNLVDWNLYTDWRLRPGQGQTTFADLYSDLVLKPRSWITFESLTRYDIDSGQFNLALHTLTLQPNDRWSWGLSHWYLADESPSNPTGLGQGNSLIASTFFYRLNENWGFRASHHFETRDGRMEEQYYTIYRDLRSWTAGLTFRFRDNRVGPDDFTVAFTFSLKAFPRFGLGSDTVRPYFLLGG
ncbi:MAG: LPS-assembly protein [Verrucomicrobiota bacterium]